MALDHRAQAARAGRNWAQRKADALEGTSAADWPDEWSPAWAGELHLHGPRIDAREFDALLALANREAAARWSDLVLERRAAQDARSEAEDTEARAVSLFEALRGHTPEGIVVGRDGSRVYLQDVANSTELTVSSLGQASRVISDWQEHHRGR